MRCDRHIIFLYGAVLELIKRRPAVGETVAGRRGNVSNVPTRMRKASLIKEKEKKYLLLDIVDASEVAARPQALARGRGLRYIVLLHA